MESNNDKVRSMLQGVLQYEYELDKDSLVQDYIRIKYDETIWVPSLEVAREKVEDLIYGPGARIDTLLQLVNELPPYLFLAAPRAVVGGTDQR